MRGYDEAEERQKEFAAKGKKYGTVKLNLEYGRYSKDLTAQTRKTETASKRISRALTFAPKLNTGNWDRSLSGLVSGTARTRQKVQGQLTFAPKLDTSAFSSQLKGGEEQVRRWRGGVQQLLRLAPALDLADLRAGLAEARSLIAAGVGDTTAKIQVGLEGLPETLSGLRSLSGARDEVNGRAATVRIGEKGAEATRAAIDGIRSDAAKGAELRVDSRQARSELSGYNETLRKYARSWGSQGIRTRVQADITRATTNLRRLERIAATATGERKLIVDAEVSRARGKLEALVETAKTLGVQNPTLSVGIRGYLATRAQMLGLQGVADRLDGYNVRMGADIDGSLSQALPSVLGALELQLGRVRTIQMAVAAVSTPLLLTKFAAMPAVISTAGVAAGGFAQTLGTGLVGALGSVGGALGIGGVAVGAYGLAVQRTMRFVTNFSDSFDYAKKQVGYASDAVAEAEKRLKSAEEGTKGYERAATQLAFAKANLANEEARFNALLDVATPNMLKLTRSMGGAQAGSIRLGGAIMDEVAPAIIHGIDVTGRFGDEFRSGAAGMAQSMSRVAVSILNTASRGQQLRSITEILRSVGAAGAPALRMVGNAALFLANTLQVIMPSALTVLSYMSRMTQAARRWSGSAEGQGVIGRTWAAMTGEAQRLWRVAVDLGHGLWGVSRAIQATGVGNYVMSGLETYAQKFRGIMQAGGDARREITAFGTGTKPALAAAGGVALEAGHQFLRVAKAVANVGMRNQETGQKSTVLVEILKSLRASLEPIANLLIHEFKSIGPLIPDLMQNLAHYFEVFARATPEMQFFLATFNRILGAFTRLPQSVQIGTARVLAYGAAFKALGGGSMLSVLGMVGQLTIAWKLNAIATTLAGNAAGGAAAKTGVLSASLVRLRAVAATVVLPVAVVAAFGAGLVALAGNWGRVTDRMGPFGTKLQQITGFFNKSNNVRGIYQNGLRGLGRAFTDTQGASGDFQRVLGTLWRKLTDGKGASQAFGGSLQSVSRKLRDNQGASAAWSKGLSGLKMRISDNQGASKAWQGGLSGLGRRLTDQRGLSGAVGNAYANLKTKVTDNQGASRAWTERLGVLGNKLTDSEGASGVLGRALASLGKHQRETGGGSSKLAETVGRSYEGMKKRAGSALSALTADVKKGFTDQHGISRLWSGKSEKDVGKNTWDMKRAADRALSSMVSSVKKRFTDSHGLSALWTKKSKESVSENTWDLKRASDKALSSMVSSVKKRFTDSHGLSKLWSGRSETDVTKNHWDLKRGSENAFSALVKDTKAKFTDSHGISKLWSGKAETDVTENTWDMKRSAGKALSSMVEGTRKSFTDHHGISKLWSGKAKDDATKNTWDMKRGMLNAIGSLPDPVKQLFAKIGANMVGPISSAKAELENLLNGIIGFLNSILSKVGLPTIGSVGGGSSPDKNTNTDKGAPGTGGGPSMSGRFGRARGGHYTGSRFTTPGSYVEMARGGLVKQGPRGGLAEGRVPRAVYGEAGPESYVTLGRYTPESAEALRVANQTWEDRGWIDRAGFRPDAPRREGPGGRGHRAGPSPGRRPYVPQSARKNLAPKSMVGGGEGLGATMHTYIPEMEAYKNDVMSKFPGIYTNTYSNHPASGGGLVFPQPHFRERSIDHWGGGGRGAPVGGTGDQVTQYAIDRLGADLNWLIWSGKMLSASGWGPDTSGFNHYDHVHVTAFADWANVAGDANYSGVGGSSGSSGGGGVSLPNPMQVLFDQLWKPLQGRVDAFKESTSGGYVGKEIAGAGAAKVAGSIHDWIDQKIPDTILGGGGGGGGGSVSGSFSGSQKDVALEFAKNSVSRGMPGRLPVMTALQESGMKNLDYGHMDSLGYFQQRPGAGWGTPEQIMDPSYALGKFLDAAEGFKGQYENTATGLGQWAQAVQISAFPDAYAKHWDAAAGLIGDPKYYARGGVATAGGSPGSSAGPGGELSVNLPPRVASSFTTVARTLQTFAGRASGAGEGLTRAPNGGIATGRSLIGIAGEDGPESIVPLSRVTRPGAEALAVANRRYGVPGFASGGIAGGSLPEGKWDLVGGDGFLGVNDQSAHPDLVRKAMSAWAALGGVRIGRGNDVTITNGYIGQGVGGAAYSDGRIVVNPNVARNLYGAYQHEIGHALRHPHNSAYSAMSGDRVITDYDRRLHAQMWGTGVPDSVKGRPAPVDGRRPSMGSPTPSMGAGGSSGGGPRPHRTGGGSSAGGGFGGGPGGFLSGYGPNGNGPASRAWRGGGSSGGGCTRGTNTSRIAHNGGGLTTNHAGPERAPASRDEDGARGGDAEGRRAILRAIEKQIAGMRRDMVEVLPGRLASAHDERVQKSRRAQRALGVANREIERRSGLRGPGVNG